jgi:hypothetical protein
MPTPLTLQQLAADAVELAALAAQRKARYENAAFRKRSGGKPRLGKGSHSNSLQHGLAGSAAAVYVCSTAGCLALVDAGRARAGARAAQRTLFQPGDGCAGQFCAKRYRPARFQFSQLRMAAALASGERWLADWPDGIGSGIGKRRGSAAARQAAWEARRALPSPRQQ